MLSRILTRRASEGDGHCRSFVRLFIGAMLVCFAYSPDLPGQLRQTQQTGETQVFGLTAKGSRFVYVFDRSLSMKGEPLAAAKRELLASLSHLQRLNQFQIVFYNESPKLMRLSPGETAAMIFADEDGLKGAESFVN